uniref:Reverse transcriptase domain-containing protein n=1 Tax=Oreochromis niloticus TaxID=8128 RepID=A0A669ELI9_ORENI
MGKIIAWSTMLKKKKSQELFQLQDRLRALEQSGLKDKNTTVTHQIRQIKQEIDKILSEEVEKNIRFMKQRYYEAGPKAAKQLAWRIRKQQAENNIYKIRDPVGNKVVTDLDKIQKAFEMYYKSLYSQSTQGDVNKITDFLNSLDLPTIGREANSKLTSLISREEISKAISSLKSNKSPGTDGLPAEWYKTMKESLLPLLETSFNYILEGGLVPPSWKEAFISVLPKEGQNRLNCKSYRPISVLNSDYKLYTTILVRRMDAIMPSLIDEDQTGFLKNRQTHDNIRRALHIIEHIDNKKNSSIILSLDAEKAYDSVNWDFLFLVMKRFGFCSEFIKCFQALYSLPTARIKINGSLSDTILLERGCRQGCPASPYLFNLFIEPLAQAIRQETSLKGIVIGGDEYKVCLYADDVLVTITDPSSGIPVLMGMLETYGLYSGYVLNVKKTQVLTFNFSPDQTLLSKFKFNWEATAIKYLGVFLPKDLTQLYDINYSRINREIYSDLNIWALLPLDLGNRIRIIKMSILPKLLYLFLALPIQIPEKQFREWNKQISRFIWLNKRPRVKFSTLQLPKEKRGLALPSLRDYYLSAQLRSLVCWCNPSFCAKWKTIEMSLSDTPIQSRLGHAASDLDGTLTPSRWVTFTLKIWRGVVKQAQLHEEIKLLKWPAYDPDFLPASHDSRFRQWVWRGITAGCSVIVKSKIMAFDTLCKTYDLEKQDFFRYLQLRDYIGKRLKSCVRGDFSIVNIFTDAYDSGSNRALISKLYKCMTKLKGVSTIYIKQKWEKEMDIVITEDGWACIWETQFATTNSNMWREFCWKNIIRFFITPKQKSKFSATPAFCWRNCGEDMADCGHIFWSCPLIRPFWTEIVKIITEVLGFHVSCTFTSLYLGYFTDDLVADDVYLLRILLASAKKAITKRWLCKDPPTVSLFTSIVEDVKLMECMTFTLRLQGDLGRRRWRKWLDFTACDSTL